MNNLDELKDIEILECAQSVYLFLTDNTDINLNKSFESFMDIPSFQKMNIVLKKYNTDMIPFTQFLNCKYQISNKLWRVSPKEFFSTTKSHDFYKSIIRNLKLKICLS
jgi:hypothetical protein